MKLLALETATVAVGAAVAGDDGSVVARSVDSHRRHVETLHPLIDDVCRLAGVALGDLDAVAVDVGPGMFTGLRVGVSAAKALGTGLGLAVVPLTSLEVLVAEGPPPSGRRVVPVVDLRRGEVAWQGLGPPEALLGSVDDLVRALAASAEVAPGAAGLALVGDGAERYRAAIADALGAGAPGLEFGGAGRAAPSVAVLAALAVDVAATRAVDAAEVRPFYLREADAKINWSSRHDRTGS